MNTALKLYVATTPESLLEVSSTNFYTQTLIELNDLSFEQFLPHYSDLISFGLCYISCSVYFQFYWLIINLNLRNYSSCADCRVLIFVSLFFSCFPLNRCEKFPAELIAIIAICCLQFQFFFGTLYFFPSQLLHKIAKQTNTWYKHSHPHLAALTPRTQ